MVLRIEREQSKDERIAALEDAARKALSLLTGSEREHALVDYPDRPDFTICDLLREALEMSAPLSGDGKPTKERTRMELWYLGSMNDGLAIIDVPPAPAPVDHVNPNRPAPTLIIPLQNNDRVTQEVAERIVAEHNAALGRVCGLLDCPMCNAREKFMILPLDATVGYCMAEQRAWRITSLTCAEFACIKRKATFGDYCMEHLRARVDAETEPWVNQ